MTKVIVSDRKPEPKKEVETVSNIEPVKEIKKPEMIISEGGGETASISTGELIKAILIIVLIIALVVIAVWSYKKYRQSKTPATV